MAGQLVEHLSAGAKLFAEHGQTVKARVLTDYMTGRTDRVVWEWEVGSLGELESGMGQLMSTEASRAAFSQWERTMSEMIESAEAENWQVQ